MIYFDNAATTLTKPPEVAEAIVHAMASFGGAGRGMHEASLAAALSIYETRQKLATFFGAASAKQVAFTSNATEGLNLVIAGLVKPGDHVITSAASHNSVLRPLYRKRDQGSILSIIPVSKQGRMDYAALEQSFCEETRMVVLAHASNLTGDIYDIDRVAALCKAHGVTFVLDAAQTGGHAPIDMQAQEIDIVVFTGHKGLFGPQGTGGLCVAEGIEIPLYKVGGSGTHSFDEQHPSYMPERLEAGTLNSHGIAGLSAGLDFIESQGVEEIARTVDVLTEYFRQGISTIEGVTIYGGQEECGNCGIVALNLAGIDAAQLAQRLDADFGICVRAGAHCAPLMHEALGTAGQGAVRFSFSVFNTLKELDFALDVLEKLAQENR